MYQKLPNLVLGFHGCNKDVFKQVINEGQHLKKSNNFYDWLGNGVYFWEQNYQRAYEWASGRYGDDAAVIGAVIDLGYCLMILSPLDHHQFAHKYQYFSHISPGVSRVSTAGALSCYLFAQYLSLNRHHLHNQSIHYAVLKNQIDSLDNIAHPCEKMENDLYHAAKQLKRTISYIYLLELTRSLFGPQY